MTSLIGKSIKAVLLNYKPPAPAPTPRKVTPPAESVTPNPARPKVNPRGVPVQTDFALAAPRNLTPDSPRPPVQGKFGTPGTPLSNPYAYAKVVGVKGDVSYVRYAYAHKELNSPVPAVQRCDDINSSPEALPFITPGGDLRIPFNSPERYHWWKGGDRLTLEQIRAEIEKRAESRSSK